ncbi:MAG: tRNA (adenosine(37)-N6)-threonylcarbamoyltransferase complex dimerization subunit type 1 TsaB [Candidatus Melainabacteria bacterium HGW-Melainabacteria-1]|nr:MAG: tRNA (adenosine(37)-N6)-threonylcarbamoyltransferase complex dimerization subunit type 1 TsaB [Candidatus Melainabacteria bacterium HGW-Melainabacteria-1]
MNILSLDASNQTLSFCLRSQGQILSLQHHPQAHIEHLPGLLQSCLDTQGIEARNLDVVAILSGPGSYTGLRGTMLVARSLLSLSGVPVMLRRSPEIMLYACREIASPVLVAQSVRQQQYYFAVGQYSPSHPSQTEGIHYLLAPQIGSHEDLLQALQSFACPVAGDWPENIKPNPRIISMRSFAEELANWAENDFNPTKAAVPLDNLIPFYIRPAVNPPVLASDAKAAQN